MVVVFGAGVRAVFGYDCQICVLVAFFIFYAMMMLRMMKCSEEKVMNCTATLVNDCWNMLIMILNVANDRQDRRDGVFLCV